MSQPWHKTSNAKQAKSFSGDFWAAHREKIQSGEFWADEIKNLKDRPVDRLKMAIDNLPLPAAFREAAVATRAIIRSKRKSKENYDQELQILYWLAATDSFSIPYSARLGMPGYNVMELVPGEELKSLPFSYKELGYSQLPLLNKTDCKWLTESWGEPKKHTTLHKLHKPLWIKYEDEFERRYEAQLKSILSGGTDAPRQQNGPPSLPSPKARHGKRHLFILIALVAILLYACSR